MMKNKIIPYGNHYIDKSDIRSITQSLKKRKITTGSDVIKFEKKISSYTKSKYVSVCNSGTSALFLSLMSINVKKDDIIIMPSINFNDFKSCAVNFRALAASFACSPLRHKIEAQPSGEITE